MTAAVSLPMKVATVLKMKTKVRENLLNILILRVVPPKKFQNQIVNINDITTLKEIATITLRVHTL
jgi:hypothetical protein